MVARSRLKKAKYASESVAVQKARLHKTVSEMSNSELKAEYEQMNDLIDNVECFGSSDIVWRAAIENELGRRKISGRIVSKVQWGD
jgi:hypothetical protein